MAEFDIKIPLAAVINPVLLWLFRHGWEDPGWSAQPVNQVALGLAIHDLGSKIADHSIQEQVQALAQKVVATNAQRIVK